MRTLLCIFFACALLTARAQSGTKADATEMAFQADTETFDALFLEGTRLRLAKDYASAIAVYRQCQRLDPQSGAVLYELAQLYPYVGMDSLVVGLLEEACRLRPENYWYWNRLLSAYMTNSRTDDALKVVEDMAARFPDKAEVLGAQLQLYNQKGDLEKVVEVFDKIELREGKSEQLSMEKFRLFLRMKDEKRAFEEMRDLADEYPNDLRYQVVIGDLYLDAGKNDEALAQYEAVEAKDPDNISLLLSKASYYNSLKQDSLYLDYVLRVLNHREVDHATRTRMLTVIVRENLNEHGDQKPILALFDKVLERPQETPDILMLKANYLVARDAPQQQVADVVREALKVDPENDMARQQLLMYAVQNNDTAAVVELCQPAVDYKMSDPVYYYYLGIAYLQLEENQKALDVFAQGLKQVENGRAADKAQMYCDIHALMGDIHHRMGNDDKAFAEYEACLTYKPENAMVLNNYAYYLSLHKKHLEKAEGMSHKAIEKEPDNATFLDTYAWVLYQLKRYGEAKQYMDRTVELMEKNGEEMSQDVLEHIKAINKKAKK